MTAPSISRVQVNTGEYQMKHRPMVSADKVCWSDVDENTMSYRREIRLRQVRVARSAISPSLRQKEYG